MCPASSRACSDCRRRARFDRAVAVVHYAPPIDWLVTRLKFQGRLNHARLLGDLLATRVHAADLDLPDVLVPVPLHPAGYRRRGFNQAERIAARLAGPIGHPSWERSPTDPDHTEALQPGDTTGIRQQPA